MHSLEKNKPKTELLTGAHFIKYTCSTAWWPGNSVWSRRTCQGSNEASEKESKGIYFRDFEQSVVVDARWIKSSGGKTWNLYIVKTQNTSVALNYIK